MEFEEMKKIWDSQNNEPFYGINEKALHNRILSKKRTGYHITNASEWLSIIANAGAGSFILAVNLFTRSENIFMFLLSAWMLFVAFFCLVSRIRRKRNDNGFDRSMLGDLRHAISVAAYQVRFSQLMWWNILPVGILIILGIGKMSALFALVLAIIFVAANFGSWWEHSMYKARKRELEALLTKLEDENAADSSLTTPH